MNTSPPRARDRRARWLPGTAFALFALVASGAEASEPAPPSIQRLTAEPIIRPSMLPGGDGDNINGPSLIEAPAWLAKPLGRYYLYFAHHQGRTIRLATADSLAGPWRIHEGGSLGLADAGACRGHVASPDVHVDDAARQVRMYFHCPVAGGHQKTLLALSGDGVAFRADREVLGHSYFRVFRFGDRFYAVARKGRLYRSADGLSGFEAGPNPLARAASDGGRMTIRHVAVQLHGDILTVYFSRIGDSPERILSSRIRLHGDWNDWSASAPREVVSAQTHAEGADLPVAPSKAGIGREPLHELRDPAVFESAGQTYLLYSVAGERGIAIGRIVGD